MKYTLLALTLLALAGAPMATAQSSEESFPITAADGFELEGRIAVPSGATVDKVIILLHGSGPQSMDVDLTPVTRDGKPNLYFRMLSDTLSEAGFAVVRYHKRSHQTNLRIQADRAFMETDTYKAYAENPLKYFVDDAMAAVGQVRERYPDAEIFLMGHSQGTYIALQAAHQGADVAGLALVGFSLTSTDVLLFEQTIYRPLTLFEDLDTDGDGILMDAEMAAESQVAASLRAQMSMLDLDGDGALAQVELQAGNMSNMVMQDLVGILRAQEAAYPRPAEILSGLDMKVAFFQGLWDNQTPAYHAKAVEFVARFVWGKQNFQFFFFPELGHALDARDRYDDLRYDTIDPEAKATLVRELVSLF